VGAVAFLLKGYPRLSETFITREIHALEQRGLDVRIYSLRRPTDRARHPLHDKIRAVPRYLPEYLHREPLRVLRAWRQVSRRPGHRHAWRAFVRDLRRDFTRNRARRFGQALVLIAELDSDIKHLHAHFFHTPGSVARYASLLSGLPWSCSAHAKDIWTQGEGEMREKLKTCAWLVTCTRHNAEFLSRLQSRPGQVALVYHGLDTVQFAPPESESPSFAPQPPLPAPHAPPSTSQPALSTSQPPPRTLQLLSVGRAVPKKGHEVLLRALARIQDLDWRFTHIGGGPLLGQLRRRARRLGMARRIHWRGAQDSAAVLQAYRAADIFVLASCISGDGDRDGLPNVLLEAQSQRVACIATRVSGIPELIDHGETGLLVAQNDEAELARALRRLMGDAGLRARLAAAGFKKVRAEFPLERGIDRLMEKFGA